MAIVGWEWIVIVGVLAIIMIWGPDKIPKLAKSVGQAKKEFDKAQKEILNPTDETQTTESSSDDILLDTAKKLGINTAGKTREQISSEIIARSPKVESPKVKVSPKKVSPKKVSPKKVSPKKVSPKKVSPKK